MQLKLLCETLKYLKLEQIYYQFEDRLCRPKIKWKKSPQIRKGLKIIEPIFKPVCYSKRKFTFLNISDEFRGWNDTSHGMLWTYNLNYMDWLGQDGMTFDEGEKWIDRFIADCENEEVKFGLDAYPTALRCNNWIKFFCQYSESATVERLDALYSQVKLLSRRLEYKIMGNHLLEDAYALYMAARYFEDDKRYKKAAGLLKQQLDEQILPDGAHYEQSPMYHCILLDRLLDCLNFSKATNDTDLTDYLSKKAQLMLGHLESIVWEDGSIPLLNDSSYDVAPTSEQIFDYAKRLGIEWKPVPMKECGYRKMKRGELEAIVDIGNIMASYQPAHSHADTFSYELRVDGKPLVVDTGISTYEDNGDRHYERSTKAHNTVSVNGKNSSHVWKALRVGDRAKVMIIMDSSEDIIAEHDGFGNHCKHLRKFYWEENGFSVEDIIPSNKETVSYIHLASGVKASIDEEDSLFVYMDERPVMVVGATNIEIQKQKVSTRYHQKEEIDVFAISFKGHLKYTIADLS